MILVDTGFGILLALCHKKKPSVNLLPQPQKYPPQLALLLANLPSIKEALKQGSTVKLEIAHLRIRFLPLREE